MVIGKLPIGIQDVEKLRVNGFAYVDKTSYVYQLAQERHPYFLGRPRRFGKSLFLSTLRAYFEGKRELFEEIAGQPQLAIARLETEWKQYPVIYLDLNQGVYNSWEGFICALRNNLEQLETRYDIVVPEKDREAEEHFFLFRFLHIIRAAAQQSGERVVVLIDEYDKPVTDTLTDPDLNQRISIVLRAFYGILKSAGQYLHFLLMTGVTRFSELGRYSGLNQIRDISTDKGYAGICGMTANELQAYFQPELKALAAQCKMSDEEVWAKMEWEYDGYHFCAESEGLFNPWSVLNTFEERKFTHEWSRTGSPRFFYTIFQNRELERLDFSKDIPINADRVNDCGADGRDPVPLLYQTGYLTIKDYNQQFRRYQLGFPNKEVRIDFLRALLPRYLDRSRARAGYVADAGAVSVDLEFHAQNFVRDLQARNVDGFMRRLQSLFALMSYELSDDTERHYQSLFFMAFTLIGAFVQAEVRSSAGRAGAVVTMKDTLYCFEFKLRSKQFARKEKPDGEKSKTEEIPALTTEEVEAAVQEALDQIDNKGYLLPYSASGASDACDACGRKLFKVGAVFDAKTRTLGGWKVVPNEG
jgi:hypothetical protein